MADSRKYITHYTDYFELKAPGVMKQVVALLLLGAVSGILSSIVIYHAPSSIDYLRIAAYGMSTGIMVISLPAFLTAVVIKTLKRKLLLRHAMLSTLLITIVYSILVFFSSAAFALTQNTNYAYVVLLVSNAAVYGYWVVMDRFLMVRGKSVIIIAAVQPLLNVLFYLPLGTYILYFGMPLYTTLIKLLAGMFVFMVVTYILLYIIDRPSRKIMEESGLKILTTMVSQWLYDLTKDVKVIGPDAGVKRELDIDILAFRGSKGLKAVFVNPDIHFGPFQGIGGSVAPLQISGMLIRRFGTVPFVLHSPLDLQDNPISTSEVYTISRDVERALKQGRNGFQEAYGSISTGKEGKCRAINIGVGDTSLFLLSKAPYVTEDFTRDVGVQLKQAAVESGKRNAILVDSHNSRFETASDRELNGIQEGSVYVKMYIEAIKKASAGGQKTRLRLGASHVKLKDTFRKQKDLGDSYTSVCVFGYGKRRFCLVYFDANNMLPGFRENIVRHIKSKFGMAAEACTTDTHSLNTIAVSAKTALGRHTEASEVIPILDRMIKKALKEMEPVRYSYKKVTINNFGVWGEKADELIARTSRDVRRILKYVVPLGVVVAFIIAAWAIYVV